MKSIREQRRLHHKRQLGGPIKPYTPSAVPRGEVNLTDPDSRRSKGNVATSRATTRRLSVNEQQIVLAAEITTAAGDFSQLGPMIWTALDGLEHVDPRPRLP